MNGCPLCGGEGSVLGSLGMRMHFRCRDCGIDYSEIITAADLIEAAAEAEEIFGDDELERYTASEHKP